MVSFLLEPDKLFLANAMMLSLMPGGVEDGQEPLFQKIEPSAALHNNILAIMHAELGDSQETVRDASVMGFVYVYVSLNPIWCCL